MRKTSYYKSNICKKTSNLFYQSLADGHPKRLSAKIAKITEKEARLLLQGSIYTSTTRFIETFTNKWLNDHGVYDCPQLNDFIKIENFDDDPILTGSPEPSKQQDCAFYYITNVTDPTGVIHSIEVNGLGKNYKIDVDFIPFPYGVVEGRAFLKYGLLINIIQD